VLTPPSRNNRAIEIGLVGATSLRYGKNNASWNTGFASPARMYELVGSRFQENG